MFQKVLYFFSLIALVQNSVSAQSDSEQKIPSSPEEIFEVGLEDDVVSPITFKELECDITDPDCLPGPPLACDSYHECNPGWCSQLLSDDQPLSGLKNQKWGSWTYSVGGALRYRYIDESNRLRPPTTGRKSSYNQWRFNPYFELKHGDDFTAYVEGIDGSTFNADLPLLPVDQNRYDLLQYYSDVKLFDTGYGEKIRLRTGRQFLQYGSQHLISPLAWSNTFRNFEGAKLYYTSDAWKIDAFATRPVNGASGNINRPYSFDHPDQSRWFSGVYTTYKNAPMGTLDIYWLWLDEDDDQPDRIDGKRHTFGTRYAGEIPMNDECGNLWMTLGWDYEGAFQVGKDVVGAGPAKDVRAGFISTNTGLTFNQVAWSPTITGVFFWGSGDDDPTDGTSNTVSTLFPLGHAYWGLIDNFSGQNLLDYSAQVSVQPTKKLTFLTAWHWFDKAQAEDAIWNVAGAPFGGNIPTASRHLGNELDLVATYAASKNVTLQAGYFWFFYGDAVTKNPNPDVANRGDADQFYFLMDCKF
ncbi:alginate export family protein [Thalassoglobus sp.]|uniref:alginate export family protein n=1 Tax=Thalassoglobus sp. TaxID=2795869 RepID=UPI003AA94ED7